MKTFSCVACLLLAASPTWAQVGANENITYSGTVTDNGVPYSGLVTLFVPLFDDNGAPLCGASIPRQGTANAGALTVTLDPLCLPFISSGRARTYDLYVGLDPIAPERVLQNAPIDSVPYALMCRDVVGTSVYTEEIVVAPSQGQLASAEFFGDVNAQVRLHTAEATVSAEASMTTENVNGASTLLLSSQTTSPLDGFVLKAETTPFLASVRASNLGGSAAPLTINGFGGHTTIGHADISKFYGSSPPFGGSENVLSIAAQNSTTTTVHLGTMESGSYTDRASITAQKRSDNQDVLILQSDSDDARLLITDEGVAVGLQSEDHAGATFHVYEDIVANPRPHTMMLESDATNVDLELAVRMSNLTTGVANIEATNGGELKLKGATASTLTEPNETNKVSVTPAGTDIVGPVRLSHDSAFWELFSVVAANTVSCDTQCHGAASGPEGTCLASYGVASHDYATCDIATGQKTCLCAGSRAGVP